jgi:hypothetical protein
LLLGRDGDGWEGRGRGSTPDSARFVTRAKYAISFLRPVQGNVPAFPMPILDVAATIRVSSCGSMVGVSEVEVVEVIVSGTWQRW